MLGIDDYLAAGVVTSLVSNLIGGSGTTSGSQTTSKYPLPRDKDMQTVWDDYMGTLYGTKGTARNKLGMGMDLDIGGMKLKDYGASISSLYPAPKPVTPTPYTGREGGGNEGRDRSEKGGMSIGLA